MGSVHEVAAVHAQEHARELGLDIAQKAFKLKASFCRVHDAALAACLDADNPIGLEVLRCSAVFERNARGQQAGLSSCYAAACLSGRCAVPFKGGKRIDRFVRQFDEAAEHKL